MDLKIYRKDIACIILHTGRDLLLSALPFPFSHVGASAVSFFVCPYYQSHFGL